MFDARYSLRLVLALCGLIATVAAPHPAQAADFNKADWIWSPKYQPGRAPQSSVYFRKTFELPAVTAAHIDVTCDNIFELFVNGQRVGGNDKWEDAQTFDVKKLLTPGKNTIAIKGTNAASGWAGLIAKLTAAGADKKQIAIAADATWLTSIDEPAGWEKPTFDDSKWQPARVLGQFGDNKLPWSQNGSRGGVAAASQGGKLTAPAGFLVEEVLGSQAGSIVSMGFHESGDLLVSKEGGPLYIVRNLKGAAGSATATVWCDKVRNCQGILSHAGHVYAVGDGPSGTAFYRLTDTKNAGQADQVETIFSFDGGMGEHGPHVATIGPDGMIYLIIGNHAHYRGPLAATSPHHDWYEGDLVQPKYEDANGHAKGIKSPGGTVVRTDVEGKKVETFCGGFRNAYDLAFNRAGELFTFDSDMEWDEGLPWYRPIRVNHCLPGAEFGWRSGWSKWPDYYLDSLGSVFDVGRGSPTGLTFYNHTAFPANYRDAFFMCDWSRGRLLVAHLQADGASFKGKFEAFVEGQPFNVTDCEVGPDGALYFTTGGRGTRGAIYRAVYTEPHDAPKPEQGIWRAIRQPQWRSAWARANVAKIRDELGHQWGPELTAAAEDAKATGDDRAQALELMNFYGPTPSPALLTKLAAAEDLTLRSKAIYLLGLHHDEPAGQKLIALLDDPQPLVRRLACEALVRAGIAPPKQKVLDLMADPDRATAWSARRLIETLPRDMWAQDVLKSDKLRTFLTGSVSLLAMAPERSTVEAVLARCGKALDDKSLSDADRLDLLRVIQLAMHRGNIEGDQVPQLRDQLAKMFPSADWRITRELTRLLVFLQTPSFAPRLVAEIDGKAPTLEKLHMAMYARFLQVGWTPDLRDHLLKFYESTRSMQGGNSFRGYFANATNDFLKTFSSAEQFGRLADGAKQPAVTLQLVQQLPANLSPEQLAALRKLDRDLVGDKRTEARELATTVLTTLGKSADDPTLGYLHSTFEAAPERRGDIAEAISLHALSKDRRPADRDLLARSLSVVDGSTGRDVLRALAKFDKLEVKPDQLRQVILLGLKLQDKGAADAVALLEHWTGQHASQPGATAAVAMAGWQQWFAKTYPNETEPKLPKESSEDKYSFAQIMTYLNEHPPQPENIARGAVVFEKALCVKCHKFGARGEAVGPDLTTLSRRFQRKEILESVLYPSAVISDQFASKTVLTQDGRTFTGIVGPTADGVTVMQSDLKRVQIAKKDIEEITPSKISAMPERLFNPLTLAEIADLFAYMSKVPE